MTRVLRITGKAKTVFKILELLAQKQGNIPINQLRIVRD